MASQLQRSIMAMRPAPLFLLFFSLVLTLLVPATASAVTVPEIVTLSKAGVSDAVLIALIERDKQVFSIDADEVAALKREGVSEAVVLAMLKSGREQSAASVQAAGPAIVIVGHDPDRPNTSHQSAAPFAPVFVVPYVFVGPVGPIDGHGACARLRAASTVPPQTGRIATHSVGHITGDSVGHITGNNVGSIFTPLATPAPASVTACERILQRAPVRPRR